MQNFVNPYTIPNNNLYTPRTPEERQQLLYGNTTNGDVQGYSNEELANQVRALAEAQPAQPVAKDTIYNPSWNILNNIAGNVGEIGTGLVHFGLHPISTVKDLGKATGKALSDYYTNMAYETPLWERPIKGAVDAMNLLNPLDIKYGDIKDVIGGKQGAGQVAGRALMEAYARPVDTFLNVLALKSLGGANKAVSKGAADIAQDAINLTNKEVRSRGYKVLDEAKKFNEFSDAAKSSAIEAFETGKKVTDTETKRALKSLKAYSESYENLVKEMSPDTHIPGNILTTNQKLVRDGLAATYADAEKATARLFNDEKIFKRGNKAEYGEIGLKQGLEEIEGKKPVRPLTTIAEKERTLTPEGKAILKQLAADGDNVAAKVLESQELYNKGWLKPVTHGLAEVDNTLKSLEVMGAMADRTSGAGRFTERVFGNAEYNDIAKQLSKPSEWLDNQMTRMVENQLATELAEAGTLGGVKAIAEPGTKGIKYVSREALGRGNLSAALETASDTAKAIDDIPLTSQMVNTLKTQLRGVRGTNPFDDTFMRDMYTVGKSNALASGGYLVGNAQTGLYNMFLNEGLNPVNMIRDLGAAMATKGNLAKELGVFRDASRAVPRAKTPGLKQIQAINAPVSNMMQYLDAKMQNLFAETAIHANLRNQGIKAASRADALMNMDSAKLADIIKDSKMVALINPTKTLLPSTFHKAAGLTNPFWRWVDTAAQATDYMFRKHPLLSYYVMVDGLAKIGFDREMQNRANLNVKSDRPFVSYRMNPRTGKVQETSMEFSPMMNTLKVSNEILSGQFKDALGNTIPAFSAIANSFTGMDRYGNPIKRPEMSSTALKDIMAIQNGKRYTWVPGHGFTQEVGGLPDEVLTAVGRELIAYPNLYNRTVAPIVAGLTGNTYYRPYQSSLFGTFNRAGYGEVPLQAGNPRSGASTTEMKDLFTGAYSREYFPEKEYTSKSLNRRLMKGAIRRGIQDRSYLP